MNSSQADKADGEPAAILSMSDEDLEDEIERIHGLIGGLVVGNKIPCYNMGLFDLYQEQIFELETEQDARWFSRYYAQ